MLGELNQMLVRPNTAPDEKDVLFAHEFGSSHWRRYGCAHLGLVSRSCSGWGQFERGTGDLARHVHDLGAAAERHSTFYGAATDR